MNFLLTYYFKSWCCPFKFSRWFSGSVLILELGLFLWLIRDRWWFCLYLSGLSHANAPTEFLRNATCLVQTWIWGEMGEASPLSLYWPGRIAAVGSLSLLPLETTQPLKGAENSLRLYSVLPRQQPAKLSGCKESSSLWRIGTFVLAGERLSRHITQQRCLPPCWGKRGSAPSPPCHSKPALAQATGRRHSLATGKHPAAEICRELKVWGGGVWNLSSKVDPDTTQTDLCVQREKEPAEKDEDLTCFSDS